MTEMVLVVPFFLIVISLLFYLGRGLIRVQHTQVVDRYEAWRAASGAPEPAANNTNNNTLLNQTFYSNKAVTMEFDEHNVRVHEADDQFALTVESDPRLTAEGAKLAHEINSRNAAWFFAHVKSEHDMSASIWDKLDGPMYHTHIRMGHDWSFATLWRLDPDPDIGWTSAGGGGRVETSIRETYFEPLEDALTNLVPSANDPTPQDTTPKPQLANRIKGLYVSSPHYRGPTVKF